MRRRVLASFGGKSLPFKQCDFLEWKSIIAAFTLPPVDEDISTIEYEEFVSNAPDDHKYFCSAFGLVIGPTLLWNTNFASILLPVGSNPSTWSKWGFSVPDLRHLTVFVNENGKTVSSSKDFLLKKSLLVSINSTNADSSRPSARFYAHSQEWEVAA